MFGASLPQQPNTTSHGTPDLRPRSKKPDKMSWCAGILAKRKNKPVMSLDDSRKAARQSGWRARRGYELEDKGCYAHNVLASMKVPRGHCLYERIYSTLTAGIDLTTIKKTDLLLHLGLGRSLMQAEMQLSVDDILSIYILVSHLVRQHRALNADGRDSPRRRASWTRSSTTRRWLRAVAKPRASPPGRSLLEGNGETQAGPAAGQPTPFQTSARSPWPSAKHPTTERPPGPGSGRGSPRAP